MVGSSRRKLYDIDGYKEIYAKEQAAKRKGTTKIPRRYTEKSKELKKLMVADRKRRKISARSAKLLNYY